MKVEHLWSCAQPHDCRIVVVEAKHDLYRCCIRVTFEGLCCATKEDVTIRYVGYFARKCAKRFFVFIAATKEDALDQHERSEYYKRDSGKDGGAIDDKPDVQ